MTQVKVILTKNQVFVTFYKTCHLKEMYAGNVENGDRYNDPSAQMARALAFSLASKCASPVCSIVNYDDQIWNDKQLFEYLNKCHPNG